MVAKGSLGKYTPGKPSPMKFGVVVFILAAFALGMGRTAGVQPTGEWRYFSWHPFLMTCGMVGIGGAGAMIKKLGGYTNTKLHGMMGFASIFCNLAGLYVIYNNKEINGYNHLKSAHAKIGLAVFMMYVGLGMAGGIFLHPDFGVDKTNKTIRFAHKTASRLTLMMAWFTAFYGLYGMTQDGALLAMYGFPLLVLVPLVLM